MKSGKYWKKEEELVKMKDTFVYIGTYTNGDSKSEGIYIYRFDPLTGGISLASTKSGIENPTFLKVSFDGNFLYAVSEVFDFKGKKEGALFSYEINKQTGELLYLNSQSTKGACPCHIEIENSGSYALVSNYMGGNLAVIPLQKDGTIGEVIKIIQHKGCSQVNPERQEGPHVHSATITTDNKFALVADLGQDMVKIYKLDNLKDKLLLTEYGEFKAVPGAGPRHMDFHPSGRYIYLLNELGNTVEAFYYVAEEGCLELINRLSTLPSNFEGENIAADIHVHPNGKFLYASNRGHNSIAIYTLDENTGAPGLLEHQSTLGEHPRNFSIDPTGNYLLVANKDSNNIVTFAIDSSTGLLVPAGREVKVPQPVCISFGS